jgi:polysaccharide export outer membrane protein
VKKIILNMSIVLFFVLPVAWMPPPTAAGGPYLIGEGDVLEISVWKNPSLSASVTVRPDGAVSLPLIQDLRVAGLSPEQARQLIFDGLSDFVNDPVVTVNVAEANSYRVYILGAVVTNGMFVLPTTTSALQLLAQAGGPLPEADLEKGVLIRNGETLPLPLKSQFESGQGEKRELRAGDVVMIPFRSEEAYTPRVLVIGEIMTPRAVPFQEGMTVLDAYVEGGGGTEYADEDSVRVIRRKLDGSEEEIPVDLKKVIKKGDLSQNVSLLPGDIVVVP